MDLNGPPAAIEDGCYCELCLSSFGRYCGEAVARRPPPHVSDPS